MFTIALFLLSGIVLATIMLAKRMEEKRRKTPLIFVLRAISRGDERLREFNHQAVHFYSQGKEKAVFFITKQLPMRSRISITKVLNLLRERTERQDRKSTRLNSSHRL